MDKYYHFTNYNSFYKIRDEGLIPNIGIRCQSIDDYRSGIFLSQGIPNAIIMYANIFDHYLENSGYEGIKRYMECLENIEKALKHEREYGVSNYTIDEKKFNISLINRIIKISSFGDFLNYLGGQGCYLSITGLDTSNDIHKEDCCYKNIIPPTNINVVNIKNKYTNNHIILREEVLYYFMDLFKREEILKIARDGNKSSVIQLYNYKDMYNLGYNYKNIYDIVEIPITQYKKPNEKALIFY